MTEQELPRLTDLAVRHGTDKWNAHWYAQHYDRHFSPFRASPIRLLEIGIGGYRDPNAGGQSLRMWRDYFPNGQIVGIDIHEKSPHAEARVAIYKGSQVDLKFLKRVVDAAGPFDIIIDDGSHNCNHVKTSFEWLFRHGLTKTGIYAAEDLQTSYWQAYGGSSNPRAHSTSMGHFKALTDGLNWMEMHRPGKAPNYFEKHVVGVHFYQGLVFVEKGENDQTSTMVSDRNVPLGLRYPTLARARALTLRLAGRRPKT